jgi:hypothetical protein
MPSDAEESDHAQQEVLRIKEELVWRAAYLSRFVFLSARAVAFGESNRPENRHIPKGTNALSHQLAGPESPQELIANIRGHSDLRKRTRDVCN